MSPNETNSEDERGTKSVNFIHGNDRVNPSTLSHMPCVHCGVLIANFPLISGSIAGLQERKTEAGGKVFVGSSGWLKRAFKEKIG